jgi:hypothetical protein
MNIKNKKQLVTLSVIALGLIVTLFLVKNPQIFSPKASVDDQLPQLIHVTGEKTPNIECNNSGSDIVCKTQPDETQVNIQINNQKLDEIKNELP